MRILIVTDQYPPMVGGVPNVTHGLAVDLAQRGHNVWVVAPSYGPRDTHRSENHVHVYRFSSFAWPTYEELRIPFLPMLPVRNLLKKLDPDIIHLHSPAVLGNIAQLMAGGLRKPLIATNHYLPINMSRSLSADPVLSKPFNNVTYTFLINFCNRCEYVTAPTQTALNLLYEHGLHAPAKAISNGIDLAKFSPGPRDTQIRKQFGLPEDVPLAIHVNRLSEEKRNDVLLNAVAQMTVPGHVALVGTGPMEAELRALADRLHINDRVSFLGYVRDAELLDLRRSADLFVIPSEADLQSLSTMEAMACGLPIIAANSYALPELAHHGENGFLFQPGNSEELARQIDLLFTDNELRQRMGQESLAIIAKHDRLLVLDEWEALYRRLSSEFVDAKARKQLFRVRSKARGVPQPEEYRSRIRRTGDLAFDQPTNKPPE